MRKEEQTMKCSGDARPSDRRRGNSPLEFAVALPFLVLMLFGTITTGLLVERHLTVMQLARNGGNMFARSVDFSRESNKQVLLKAATGLSMTTTDGKGVIYLSKVMKARAGSANEGKFVIAERFVIGNSSLKVSRLGTPSSSIWPDPDNPQPNGDVARYDDEESAVVTAPLPELATLPAGKAAYIAEAFHDPSELTFASLGQQNIDVLHSQAVF